NRLFLHHPDALHQYALDGSLEAIEERTLPNTPVAHWLLEPATGEPWQVQGSQLAQIQDLEISDAGGFDLGAPVLAAVAGNGEVPFWLLTPEAIHGVDTQGNILSTLTLPAPAEQLSLRFDPVAGKLWLLAPGQVHRHAGNGEPEAGFSVPASTLFDGDGHSGLWLAHDDRLRHLQADGSIGYDLALAQIGHAGPIDALVADPRNASVWIGIAGWLLHLDPSGNLLHQQALPSQSAVHALGLYADTWPPTLAIVEPPDQSYLDTSAVPLLVAYDDPGRGIDPDTLSFERDGTPHPAACSHSGNLAQCLVDLPEGSHRLTARIADRAGNTSPDASIDVTVDTTPPIISVTSPNDGLITNHTQQLLVGEVSEPATLALNGESLSLDATLRFQKSLMLKEGSNSFVLTAVDRAGNRSERPLNLELDTVPPEPVRAELLTFAANDDGTTTISGAAGSVEAGASVIVTNLRTGTSVSVKANAEGAFTIRIETLSGDGLLITVRDAAGNDSLPVDFGAGLPPSPAAIAPPLAPNAITPMHEAVAFLYTGANPIQTGVASGTIEPRRVAVIRGRVIDRSGEPLSGVAVSIKDRPELGQTLSRSNGEFDLAVNGGGWLTIDYVREGFLPAQRKVNVPWRDYVSAPDVALVPLDPVVSLVALGEAAPMQIARGSQSSDTDGERQATLIFPAGTSATLRLPDGSERQLDTMHVRATEYTVGANGPQAMPGELPPMSGYTYAVELSVDEAIAAGAARVDFDRPVAFYVENFLAFPVGGVVPAGWYDREKAAWIPSDNGRVIGILSITSGLADLDLTGSGQPADEAALSALGITLEERRRLAEMYQPGQSLWRTPITHFTPWDCNWPYGPPPDATPPGQSPPTTDDNVDDPTLNCGSIIECQNQVLGETLPIAGTPFTLNYRSNRVPGRRAAYTLDIPLSGTTVPDSLKRIELEVTIAGQVHRQIFPAAPNQQMTFVWDGRDAYGREVKGRQSATVRIGYVYGVVYYRPSNFAQAFAQASNSTGGSGAGGSVVVGDRSRMEITYWQTTMTTVSSPFVPSEDMGGWELDIRHSYDVNDGLLMYGSGGWVSSRAFGAVIETAAGNGSGGNTGDGESALNAGINGPYDVAVAPDGSIFIAADDRVRKIDPQGVITTVPGTEGRSGIWNLAVDANGSVYFTSRNGGPQIFRADPDGTVHHVAGNGASAFAGDGGPATEASFINLRGLAAAPDGSLYVADFRTHRVRRIGPDGIIRTVAGNGSSGIGGIGGPAVNARIDRLYDVAVGPDGDIYIDSHNYSIFHVSKDGIIRRVAGSGCNGFSGDGGLATAACMGRVSGVAVRPDGVVAIADIIDNRRIRAVTMNGIIRTVAGGGNSLADSSVATDARIGGTEIAFGPFGEIYLADSSNRRVRRLMGTMPGFSAQDVTVADQDGGRLYRFDMMGRHLDTRDAATQSIIHRFTYDAENRLIAITDANGNVTTIERDAAGLPAAIVAPDGQRTRLTLGGSGYLASIANPAGDTHRIEYTNDGLLTRFIRPNGNASIYTYDALGRLVRTQDAAGGGWILAREEQTAGHTVTLTSAEGRSTHYQTERLSVGDERLTDRLPDGSTLLRRNGFNGERQVTRPDGTLVTTRLGPDPRFGMMSPVPTVRETR
ncbi:MAG: Ig-like domain-containing protein, partial [Chromatiales bacterium]|nr:Ig-like domain-containing protein [Chromatiales bacterium]